MWFINKFRRKKETPQDGFTLIHTDALGNNWYSINNPANIHATRALIAWGYSRDAEFGMNRNKLSIACDKLNESLNKKDFVTAAKIVGVVEAGLSIYADPEILLNLATCYTFLNDEKNDGYKDHYQDKKREIWQSDFGCKAFFLQWSIQYTGRRSELQNLNVHDFLEKSKLVIDQINYHLQKK